LLTARRLKFLSLALLMSGGTVVLTQQWLQGAVKRAQMEAQASSPAKPIATRRVLVANAPIPPGTILKADQIHWQPWPADTASGAYMTEANTRMDEVVGSVVRTGLEAGEPLSQSRIIAPGDRSFLAAVLRPGYRAVTVNVSASTGVAGFIMPGDHVDLILSRAVGDPNLKRFVSETVLSDVRVVGMDQRATTEKKDVLVPQTATLEVTAKGAEVVAVVTQLGALSLALRSVATPDTLPVEVRQVTRTTDSDAIQAPRAPAAVVRQQVAKAPSGPRIQIYRGAESSFVSIGQSGGE
jgi:pilus assembly protein CpaB